MSVFFVAAYKRQEIYYTKSKGPGKGLPIVAIFPIFGFFDVYLIPVSRSRDPGNDPFPNSREWTFRDPGNEVINKFTFIVGFF